MKIFLLLFFFLSLAISSSFAHSSGHKSGHSHTQDKQGASSVHDHHHHDEKHADHDHHHHQHEEKNTPSHEHSRLLQALEAHLPVSFSEISENKVLMMSIAVVLISLPSVPTFFVLVFISKLNPNKSKDAPIMNERYLRWMICLAIGSLTGDVFFGMMEHIMSAHAHDHAHDHNESEHNLSHKHEFKLEIFCILVGIFFFYMVDRMIGDRDHHHHHHEEIEEHEQQQEENSKGSAASPKKRSDSSEVRKRNVEKNNASPKKEKQNAVKSSSSEVPQVKKTDRSVILYLVADFLHNVIDGIGIGVAFSINNSLGLTTTVAIATHELPHEIGDFAILMKKNYSLGAIMLTQLGTATGALVGGFLGIFFGNFAESYLLGFTAGGFLYLALANMIPELLHTKKKPTIWNVSIEALFLFLGSGLIILSA